MLKNRFALAALVLALLAALVPAPSHAAPWGWNSASTVSAVSAASAAGFFQKIGSWWNSILNGTERPAHRQGSIDIRKNGCGIDPNGTPCGTGAGAGGTGTTAVSDPADPSGTI